MAARNDQSILQRLLPNVDNEVSRLASHYLNRLRKHADASSGNELLRSNQTTLPPIAALLACEKLELEDVVTELSAQKASFTSRPIFGKCVQAARNLIDRASNPNTPQKSPPKPSKQSLSFESLADEYEVCEIGEAVIDEMYDVQAAWERVMTKTSPAKQTSWSNPRYTRAIFVWVLSVLQYPMDKSAFAKSQKMLPADLDTILSSLNEKCKSKRVALEKKVSLPSHLYVPSSAPSPSKSLKRKQPDTPAHPYTTPTKKQRTPAEPSDKRQSLYPIDGLDAVASSPVDPSPSHRALRSTLAEPSPLRPQPTTTPIRPSSLAPTPSRLRSVLTTPAGTSRTPGSAAKRARFISPEPAADPSEHEDEDEAALPVGRRRRLAWMDRLGPSHEENVRLIEWFEKWKERVVKIGWTEVNEDEVGHGPVDEDVNQEDEIEEVEEEVLLDEDGLDT